MLHTLQELQKIGKALSKYCFKKDNEPDKEEYFFKADFISKEDAETLLDYDDVFYGTYDRHIIDNYEELRLFAPEWESMNEYLQKELKKRGN